jgi:hypothetical protein
MIRKLAVALATVLLCAGMAYGQQNGNIVPLSASPLHRVGNQFYAPGYSTWAASILIGNAASGSATIYVYDSGGAGAVTLGDGTSLPFATVFNTATPIRINDANAETVTPSAVTVGACPPGFAGIGSSAICAAVTATFANTHGAGTLPVVASGDGGIEEAITDAQNNGGGSVYFEADCGIVTLSTSSTTTTTTNCQIPLNFVNLSASGRVTTTVTTSANWSVGITGSTTAFISTCTQLTAGQDAHSFLVSPTKVSGTYALTAVLITTNANAGAGAIHVKVLGYSSVQSNQ